jgi:hypothetical protein
MVKLIIIIIIIIICALEGVLEQGAEEDIWTEQGSGVGRVQKTA